MNGRSFCERSACESMIRCDPQDGWCSGRASSGTASGDASMTRRMQGHPRGGEHAPDPSRMVEAVCLPADASQAAVGLMELEPAWLEAGFEPAAVRAGQEPSGTVLLDPEGRGSAMELNFEEHDFEEHKTERRPAPRCWWSGSPAPPPSSTSTGSPPSGAPRRAGAGGAQLRHRARPRGARSYRRFGFGEKRWKLCCAVGGRARLVQLIC